jgi:hypothetical protein
MEVRKLQGSYRNVTGTTKSCHITHTWTIFFVCLWEWGRLWWVRIGYNLSALDKALLVTVFSGCKLLFILKTKIQGITSPPPPRFWCWAEEFADNSQVFQDVTLFGLVTSSDMSKDSTAFIFRVGNYSLYNTTSHPIMQHHFFNPYLAKRKFVIWVKNKDYICTFYMCLCSKQ